MNPAILIKRNPRVLLETLKLKAFLFKERHFRFRGFSPHVQQGVNVAGYVRAEAGLGQSVRGFAVALTAARIPFSLINFEEGNNSRHGDLSWVHKETDKADFDITLLVINPDNILRARARLPPDLFRGRYVIGNWFWELPKLPGEWEPAFSLVNEVWAASEFIRETAQRKSPVPVIKMPPVVFVGEGGLSREYFGLPDRCFLFLTMCDTGSIFERKNPLAAIEAFKRAFPPNRTDVGLVVKISGPEHRTPNWDLIQAHVAGYSNIWIIDRLLNREELSSLLRINDCCLSLHRSEGFGLVPAEMMSLGKPAILTGWSGNLDYMSEDNSIGIGYKLVELREDHGPYEAGQQWADPDIEQAAYWIRKLSEDPQLGRTIGNRGRETIVRNHSPLIVGEKIRQRLATIREQHT